MIITMMMMLTIAGIVMVSLHWALTDSASVQAPGRWFTSFICNCRRSPVRYRSPYTHFTGEETKA